MIKTPHVHFIYHFFIITGSIVSISCLLSTILLYSFLQKELTQTTIKNQQIFTDLIAQNIKERLDELRKMLQIQTKLRHLTDAIHPSTKDSDEILKKTANHFEELYLYFAKEQNFKLINRNGSIVASTNPQRIGVKLAKEPYVQAILFDRDVRSLYLIKSPSKPISILLSEAIHINNSIEGLLALTTSLDNLVMGSILKELKKKTSLVVYLVETDGTVLLQSGNNASPASSITDTAWFAQSKKEPSGSVIEDINDTSSLISFVHIPSTKWIIMLAMPASTVFAPIERFLRASIFINGLLLLASLLGIILLTRKPLAHVKNVDNLQMAVGFASQKMRIIINSQLQIQDATATFLEILAAPSKQHLIEYWQEYIPTVQPSGENSLALIRTAMEQAVNEGKTRLELVLYTYQKTPLPLAVNVIPLVYQKKNVFLIIFRDLRKQKAYEQSLQQIQLVAEEDSKAKTKFLANMSHEIRTPMNAIIGMLYLTKQTELTPKQHDYIEKIETVSKSLLIVINDLLDFSKIEAGHVKLKETPFHFLELINKIINISKNKLYGKDIELFLQINTNVPNYLIGDPKMLSHVLTNLLSNAVKFTQEGEIIVRLSVQSAHENQLMLCFAVQDTGIGMEHDQMLTVFNSSTQANTSITRHFDGIKLGLIICKKLVTLMGGSIRVTSKKDIGSTFTFTARFTQDTMHKSAEKAFEQEQFKGLPVLVIDDNVLACKILKETLEHLGMYVTTASSGDEALQLIQNVSPFALVLIDLRMSGLNNIDTVEQLRKHPDYTSTPFILASTYEHEEAFQYPDLFCHVLEKPIFAQRLLDLLLEIFVNKIHQPKQIPVEKLQEGTYSKGHVLVAEDKTINQQGVAELLTSLGLQVTIVNNGQEVLKEFQKTQFDAIFMDIQMPVMDGLETTLKIREYEYHLDKPAIIIIAMEAHTMTSNYQKSLNAGMNDHIAKPIDPEALRILIHKLLAQKVHDTRPVESS